MNHYIYLSSTVYKDEPHCHWKQDLIHELNTRDDFKKDHAVTFIDPIQYTSSEPCVVGMDIQNIKLCDIVVFYIEQLSIGTIMELAYCTLQDGYPKKNLYLVSTSNAILKHPWIRNLIENNANSTPFRQVIACSSTKEAVDMIIADTTENKTTTNNTRKIVNEG